MVKSLNLTWGGGASFDQHDLVEKQNKRLWRIIFLICGNRIQKVGGSDSQIQKRLDPSGVTCRTLKSESV